MLNNHSEPSVSIWHASVVDERMLLKDAQLRRMIYVHMQFRESVVCQPHLANHVPMSDGQAAIDMADDTLASRYSTAEYE